MQAAITAFDRGHDVILAEKTQRLGGLLNFTDTSAHKKDIHEFKELLIREIARRKIKVCMECEVNEAVLAEMKPDALILAVGSDDLQPKIPGIENAVSVLDIYDSDFKNAEDEVILLGGGLVGCETALDLAEKGISVTIIEKCERLMPDGYGIYRTAVMDQLREKQVTIVTNAVVLEIGVNNVKIAHKDGTNETLIIHKKDTIHGKRALRWIAVLFSMTRSHLVYFEIKVKMFLVVNISLSILCFPAVITYQLNKGVAGYFFTIKITGYSCGCFVMCKTRNRGNFLLWKCSFYFQFCI